MFRRLLYHIQDYFGVSPREARGALLLLVLCVLLLGVPSVVRRWVLPQLAEPPEQVLQTLTLDSLAASLADPAAGSPGTPATRPKVSADRPARLFVFNPNEATPDELRELGVPDFLARRIDNYRRKGGTFRRKQDLQRIYDFPEDLYRRLEPYIRLESTPRESAGGATPTAIAPAGSARTGTPAPYPAEVKVPGRPVVVPFDINTTDTSQLIRLRGIGSTLSLRIVRFRDALGGFHSPEQYREVFGLDSMALAELNRYARIQTDVQKLPLNSATAAELVRHPYLRNRRQTEVLVRYREQHGPYRSLDDLRKVKVLDETTLEKLAPYLAL
jgi:competence protein ComEA